MSELKSHGIDPASLADIKANLEADEFTRARAVWERKFGTVATSQEERAKQMRFLMQRGFSHRAIQAAMRASNIDED